MKSVLIVGAGDRGSTYGDILLDHRDRVRVTGVAEPRAEWRERLAAKHGIDPAHAWTDWRGLAELPQMADAAIVAVQDRMHRDCALALLDRGYHVLLEKPMAVTARDCLEIAGAARRAGAIFGVCHVLRYAPYTRRLKALLAQGVIGDPVSIQHLESVGYWHQAHSFVRGNWRNERESSFMLLAKSCHDLDWMAFVMGADIERVSSFGGLHHFRPEHAPAGSAARCLDCAVAGECPYAAQKIYLEAFDRGRRGWPLDVLAPEVTRPALEQALRDGPYGRCVYRCDNDVVDHQTVNLDFAGGRTGAFTMTAFTRAGLGRQTRIFGTRGDLHCDGNRRIEVCDFLTDRVTEYPVDYGAGGRAGHSGSDPALIESFVNALVSGDPSHLHSGGEETLRTHLAVFAAEESRRTGRTISLAEFRGAAE